MAKFTWHEAKQLDDSLSSLEQYFETPPEVAEILSGGVLPSNRCWKLTLEDQKSYIWRPNNVISRALSLSRHQEFQILNHTNLAELSPKPQLVNEQGLLIHAVVGEPLKMDPFSIKSGHFFSDKQLKILGDIHALDCGSAAIVSFNFIAMLDHYWFQLLEEHTGSEYDELYKKWRNVPLIEAFLPVLCNLDISTNNLIQSEDGIKIVSWEYAALADPRFNLAILIGATHQPLEETVQRYCQVQGIEEVDIWIEGVKAWLPRGKVFMMFITLLAHKLLGDDKYLNYANLLKASFKPQPSPTG